jgi:hypothetical protein
LSWIAIKADDVLLIEDILRKLCCADSWKKNRVAMGVNKGIDNSSADVDVIYTVVAERERVVVFAPCTYHVGRSCGRFNVDIKNTCQETHKNSQTHN